MQKLQASAVAITALLQGALAHAQVTGSATGTATDRKPPSKQHAAKSGVEEVVVTAQRRSATLSRTPVAISVLSGRALARAAITTQSDLQLAVPGLTVKEGQSSNQLNYSIRGQTVDSFSYSQPSVLPYLNEVEVSGAGSSAFYDLQSVQVLKGPQGTLFGRNSTGGAVLFTTAKPIDNLSGYLDVAGGSYKDLRQEGAINVPLVHDKVLLRISAYHQNRDGFQYNLYDDRRIGEIQRDNIRVSLTIKPTSYITNDFVADYAHSGGSNTSSVVYNILPATDGSAFVPGNLLYSPAVDSLYGPGTFARFLAAHPKAYAGGIIAFTALQNERGPYLIDVDAPNFHRADNFVITNTTTLEINTDTKIRNIVGYSHSQQDDGAEFDGTPYPLDSNGTGGRGGYTDQVSEELQALGTVFSHRLTYVAGGYYSNEQDYTRSFTTLLDLSPLSPAILQPNIGISTDRNLAVYGQGTLDLSSLTGVRGLGFTAGGRFTSEHVSLLHLPGDAYLSKPSLLYKNPDSDTYNKTSFTVGPQIQLNQNLLLYLVSRQSFRSGGFNFFAPPLPGFGNSGGSEFKPETATDVEIGAKYNGQLNNTPFRLNVDAYNMWVDNVQRSDYVEIEGELAGITVNVPRAEISGFEMDGLIKPRSWLTLGGSLNYTDARFTSNLVSVPGNATVAFGPYPDTPRWSGAVYSDVVIPVTRTMNFFFHADTYYQTSTFFSSTNNTLNPGTEIPDYAIVDFRLGVESEDGRWSLTAYLKNAMNRTYYTGGIGFASLLSVNTVIPGDPRTFLIEARSRF